MYGEIIKRHYCDVMDKQGFCHRLGEVVGRNGTTIFSHWFGTYLNIPEKQRAVTLRELKKELKRQIKRMETTLKLEA